MKKIDLERKFVEIVKQYERIIYKVCSFYASPELPIADLYQEVVCNLWAGFQKFRGECSVSTWIYRLLSMYILCLGVHSSRGIYS